MDRQNTKSKPLKTFEGSLCSQEGLACFVLSWSYPSYKTLSMQGFITTFCESIGSTARLPALETNLQIRSAKRLLSFLCCFQERILSGVWTRAAMSFDLFVCSVYTLLLFSFSLYPLGKQETRLH